MTREDLACHLAQAYAKGAEDYDLRRDEWPELRLKYAEEQSAFLERQGGFVIFLPFPPAVNNLFSNARGGGRVPTPHYRTWRKEADALYLSQRRPTVVLGPYKFLLEAQRPDKRRRDISNLIKAAEDQLISYGLMEDDSAAEEVCARWVTEDLGGMCRVTVTPA